VASGESDTPSGVDAEEAIVEEHEPMPPEIHGNFVQSLEEDVMDEEEHGE
jgi:hypothetical protein